MNKWPTREEWAYSEQHPYWDGETGCPFSDRFKHRLSDYATQQEIAALVAALKDLYRELGREMKNARLRAAGPLNQQPGESEVAWLERIWQLTAGERDLAWAEGMCRSDRKQINDILRRIDRDEIPQWTRAGSVTGRPAELVAPFIARHDAAFHTAREQWEQECLRIPVDDAAWEQELKRRQRVADDDAHPERFIHCV